MADFNGDTIIIRDTEYTTREWAPERNWSWPNEFREIVHIWAIMVDIKTRQEISSFSIFIKPIKNPIVSDYFINLTKITQEEIDTQWKDFVTAVNEFVQWAGDTIELYAYGKDEIILAENCGLHNITLPFIRKSRFKNIVDVFLKNNIQATQYHSGTINQYFNIPNNETEHNALADARNVLHSLQELYRK